MLHGRGCSVKYVGTSTSRFLECIRYIQILGVFLYDVRYIQKNGRIVITISVQHVYFFMGQAVIISGVFRGILYDYRPGCTFLHTAFQYSLSLLLFLCLFYHGEIVLH